MKIRVSHKGYRDAEAIGQWLPGDAETLDFALAGDRVARLADLLSEGEGMRGRGAGPLIEEFAAAAGVRRIAVVTLEKDGTGAGFLARSYSGAAKGADPLFLGEKRLSPDDGEPEAAGEWLAEKLAVAGWPRERKDPGEAKPWYKNWWVWGIAVAAAGIAAALAAGGSGSSGSSGSGDSSITVDF